MNDDAVMIAAFDQQPRSVERFEFVTKYPVRVILSCDPLVAVRAFS